MTEASNEIWILGIHMTKLGKHPDKDAVDLAAEATTAALPDGGVSCARWVCWRRGTC